MSSQPIVLAFETTLSVLSVSIIVKDKIVTRFIGDGRISSSNELLAAADSVLQQNNLDLTDINCLAVCAGPGSFTGIRVGLATVKALAYGLNCRAFGISVLEALALSAFTEAPEAVNVVAAVAAGKNQIYTQTFSKNEQGKINYADSVPSLTDIVDFIKHVHCLTVLATEIIVEKKCAVQMAEIKNLPTIKIASDNVSDFIGLRGLEIYKNEESETPSNLKENTNHIFGLSPLYLRDFRLGN